MPNYRRALVPGGSFFFIVVTNRRARLFSQPRARRLLGSIFRRCLLKWPFTINALVLLPEHLHAIWSLPPGDDEYARRWGWIKKNSRKNGCSREGPRRNSAMHAGANGGTASGSRGTGNIRGRTKMTLSATSTTSITTRSKTDTSNARATGAGQASTAGSPEESIASGTA